MQDSSIFSDLHVKIPNKNTFDLSHSHKTTMKFGNLVPIMLQECLPNDTFRISLNQMVRLVPLATPTMHDIEVNTHTFFVPSRILWKNFTNLIRGPRSANDSTVYSTPYLGSESATYLPEVQLSSLMNYMGLPEGFTPFNGSGDEFRISALPFAAYQKIWLDYFADENLQTADIDEDYFQLPDGEVIDPLFLSNLLTLRRRAWQHDYFTSCLPFAQKGQPVPIPIQAEGDVEYTASSGGLPILRDQSGNPQPLQGGIKTNASGEITSDPSTDSFQYDPQGTLRAIINNVATTIKDLRVAEALQSFLEKNARAGNRYFEYLRAIFGQTSPDARLQRAEYIGGSKHQFSISDVLQTSATEADSAQGNMAGHGISVGSSNDSTYHCQEHGYIITLMSVRPKTAYAQGVSRLWTRFDRYDYAIPDFAHIGEQEVRAHEIFFQAGGTIAQWYATFGYLPRYAEYKTQPDRISGQFLGDYSPWTMPRIFSSMPSLNGTFIQCNPTNEIFPVDLSEMSDYILADTYFSITKSSVLPRFDIPSLV